MNKTVLTQEMFETMTFKELVNYILQGMKDDRKTSGSMALLIESANKDGTALAVQVRLNLLNQEEAKDAYDALNQLGALSPITRSH